MMLLLLAACSGEAGPNSVTLQASQASPTARHTPRPGATPVVQQQHLPKGLLKSAEPVMDWVFNVHCDQAVDSYSSSALDATIAYDSAAWLYPSDGHLVEGWQNCDKDALIQQARNQELPTLLTVGVDGSWSTHALAQYIDRASTEPQVPCTPQASTLICTIVNWAAAGGYRGVIIDFELVQQDYPDIAAKFATFMHKLQAALHQKGMLCGTTLISKVSDNPADDPFHHIDGFQNWKLLGGMDFLIDMVLDYDNELNQPGPITSIAWVDKALDYLWRTIPQALSKTIFEFPLYGREWRQDSGGSWQHVNDETCQQVLQQRAGEPLLSDVAADPTTPEIAWNDAGGSRHEVWYNSPNSLVGIMTQLQAQARSLLNDPQYKLPTSFWYRGAECPGFFGRGNTLDTFYNAQ